MCFVQNYVISNLFITKNQQNINTFTAFNYNTYMKEPNTLSRLMVQILHTRDSGASVSDDEAERVQHTPTLDNWLIAPEGCRW